MNSLYKKKGNLPPNWNRHTEAIRKTARNEPHDAGKTGKQEILSSHFKHNTPKKKEWWIKHKIFIMRWTVTQIETKNTVIPLNNWFQQFWTKKLAG